MKTLCSAVRVPFANDTKRSREEFFSSLDLLPRVFQVATKRLAKERTLRVSGRPLLGEYVPWLIADLFGIYDRKPMSKIVNAWLHVYYFVLMLDDIIDNDSTTNRSQNLIASSLLLQRGLSQLLSLSNQKRRLRKEIDSAFEITARAANDELSKHRGRIARFSPNEVNTLGRKMAVLTVCITAIGELATHSERDVKTMRMLFANLATGIQLLDDVTDWEEDLLAQNMTLPLTLSNLKNFSSHSTYVNDINPRDRALLVLIQTRALEKTLSAAVLAFERTIKHTNNLMVRTRSGLKAKEYFGGLLESCSYVHGVVELIREDLEECDINICQVENPVRFNIKQIRRIRRGLADVRRSLYIVANGS